MTEAAALPRVANGRGRRARAAILDAATALFAARGFEGVSVADVAAAAAVTKPSVLYHFPGKDVLWRECVEALWGEVNAHFRAEWPRNDPISRADIMRMMDVFIETSLRWPAYVRIPFIEGATPSWRSEWLVDHYFGPHVRTVDAILRDCQARGLLPPGDPRHFQNLLTAAVNVYLCQPAMWERALGPPPDAAAFLRDYARLALSLTFRSDLVDSPG